MVVDAAGDVHVVYLDRTVGTLEYAVRTASDLTWALEALDGVPSEQPITMVTDDDETLHVVYSTVGGAVRYG